MTQHFPQAMYDKLNENSERRGFFQITESDRDKIILDLQTRGKCELRSYFDYIQVKVVQNNGTRTNN